MMVQKKIGVFTGFVFLMLFSLGVVSADSCWIQSGACPGGNDYTVMKLSDTSNAHGSLYNQGSYSKYLCCDFTGGHSSSDGKIVGLSSSTNAHAQIPSLTNYGTHVYFGDLVCVNNANNCPGEYPLHMLSLSSNTNAHIGSFNTYTTKICCKHAEGSGEQCIAAGGECEIWPCGSGEENLGQKDCGFLKTCCAPESCTPHAYFSCFNNDVYWYDSCDNREEKKEECGTNGCSGSTCNVDDGCAFISASWSHTEVVEGTTVSLNIKGTNCNGETLSFEVLEQDLAGDDPVTTNPVNVVFSGNSATGRWIAEWQSDFGTDPEYYFIATIISTGDYIKSTSSSINPLLTVTQSVEPPSGYCNNITFCSSYLTNNGNECSGDICSVSETSAPPNVNCLDPAIDCYCEWNSATSTCAFGYSVRGFYCGDGIINTGETCDGTEFGPITGCSAFDEFTGGTLTCNGPGIENECHFDTSQCTGGIDEDSPLFVGSCSYIESTNDNCDDGFLTYSWTAQWVWDADNIFGSEKQGEDGYIEEPIGSGKWHYDPKRKNEMCVDGSNTLTCPAQIQLPFFTWQTLLATIIVLGVIYVTWNLNKKKTQKRKTKKRK